MKRLTLLATLALICLNAHAGLNKWVDAEGKVHYSDTPPPDAKTESVRSIAGKDQAGGQSGYTPKSLAERDAEWKKNKAAKEEAAQKQSQQNEQSQVKKQNCENARQNVRTLEEGGRVVTYDANGEKSYMDDEARAKRLEEARKAVSSNCN
jgi:hypothetical protein